MMFPRGMNMPPQLRGVAAIVAAVFLVAACASVPTWFAPGQSPPALVANWVARSTRTDTTVWEFASDGGRTTRTVRVSSGSEHSSARPGARTAVDRWYVTGDMTDSAGRELCFVQRPGRDGSSCMHFWLDTLHVNGVARRRLMLVPSWSPSRAARIVLLERLP